MADSRPRRRVWGSRSSSVRSSAVLDDHLHPGYHALRPAESRFSLNEHFAATRREYEFGYDDASSVRASVVDVDQDDQDDTLVLEDGIQPSAGPAVRRNFYEILCLPQHPSPEPAEIRRAYRRLVRILSADTLPGRWAPVAEALLDSVQDAFETLIEPYKRADYDVSVDPDDSDEDETVDYLDHPAEQPLLPYAAYLAFREAQTTDLGLRLEPRRLLSGSLRSAPLDFSLRQSTAWSVPAAGRAVRSLVSSADGVLAKLFHHQQVSTRCGDPTVELTGSIHGLLDEPFRLASLRPGPYQPPGPSVHGPRRLQQLTSSRFLPCANLVLRQGFSWRREPSDIPDTVLEQELVLLPDPAVTTRIGHSLDLPEPLDVEVCVSRPVSGPNSAGIGLAAHKRVAGGTAFVVLDAGDWTLRPDPECAQLSRFSQAAGNPLPVSFVRNAPTVEAGYVVSSSDLGLRAGRALTKPAGRGVASVDSESGSSWAASLGATADSLAAYLRYGRDLFFSTIRAEVELGATTQRDLFLALRALTRVGRFSCFGLEVGLAPANLHLSLYWSRLGQRVSLPLLLAAGPDVHAEAVFWAVVAPFVGLAAVEIWRRKKRREKKGRETKGDDDSYIAARRAEADELTVVLAAGVETRQRLERQGGGLVILSAKYGVRGAAPDEVADVTVAVAALVDAGRLVVPAGLRKSRLLGFWDPAPRRTKLLSVRYLYRGSEYSVEVSGRDELRLP